MDPYGEEQYPNDDGWGPGTQYNTLDDVCMSDSYKLLRRALNRWTYLQIFSRSVLRKVCEWHLAYAGRRGIQTMAL